jgi:hypothetical protein
LDDYCHHRVNAGHSMAGTMNLQQLLGSALC